MRKLKKIPLILEKDNGKIWGRVTVGDNLIIDNARNISLLEKKLKKVLKSFEHIDDVEFEYSYDLTIFFEQFNFLNQSKIAELAGINSGLIRQYSSGHKQPSKEQLVKIETAIRTIAGKLKGIQLSTKSYV
jgi:transcriptional regulator with XRE-family HTH domain